MSNEKLPPGWKKIHDGKFDTTHYDEALRLIIFAKYGYGNNVDDLKRALVHIQDEIRILEGRPDPNQSDLFKQPQGENHVEEK